MSVKMNFTRTVTPKYSTPKRRYTHKVEYTLNADGSLTKRVTRSLKNVTTG